MLHLSTSLALHHISLFSLKKTKIWNLHLLPLAWDFQGKRCHNSLLLLRSSILVFLRLLLSKLWKEALKPLFSSHFSTIFVQSSYIWFQNLFFILWSSRLQYLNSLFLWSFRASFIQGNGSLSTSWTLTLLSLEARLHCMLFWCLKLCICYHDWNCVICCFYWSLRLKMSSSGVKT